MFGALLRTVDSPLSAVKRPSLSTFSGFSFSPQSWRALFLGGDTDFLFLFALFELLDDAKQAFFFLQNVFGRMWCFSFFFPIRLGCFNLVVIARCRASCFFFLAISPSDGSGLLERFLRGRGLSVFFRCQQFPDPRTASLHSRGPPFFFLCVRTNCVASRCTACQPETRFLVL